MRYVSRTLLVVVSVALVLLTAAAWTRSQRDPVRLAEDKARADHRQRLKIWNTPLDEGRCAISTASFGGTRARLVRGERDGTIVFAVIEAPARADPLEVLRQGDWLRSKFGAAPTTTLGSFSSKAAALSRAGQLCPPRLRCLPGRPGCSDTPAIPSPMEMYGSPLPPFAPTPSQ